MLNYIIEEQHTLRSSFSEVSSKCGKPSTYYSDLTYVSTAFTFLSSSFEVKSFCLFILVKFVSKFKHICYLSQISYY